MPNPPHSDAFAAEPIDCVAPPGSLCTETGCWDADRCVVRPAARPPFWCYPCSRGEHGACKGIAWQPDVECECAHDA